MILSIHHFDVLGVLYMNKIQYYGNKNIVYRKIKELRVQQNMSQGQLAAKLQVMNVNIDQQSVSRIENNDRCISDYELVCLSRIFNVDVNYLLEDFDTLTE